MKALCILWCSGHLEAVAAREMEVNVILQEAGWIGRGACDQHTYMVRQEVDNCQSSLVLSIPAFVSVCRHVYDMQGVLHTMDHPGICAWQECRMATRQNFLGPDDRI